MSISKKICLVSLVFAGIAATGFTLNANAHFEDPTETIVRAVVTKVVSQEVQVAEGIDVETDYQIIEAKILEGEKKNMVVTIEEDFLMLREGNKFFLSILEPPSGGEVIYAVYEADRRGVLAAFAALFVVAVLLLGKWKGVRSLISLAATFLIIIYVLAPQILAGKNPVVLSIFIALLILSSTIYFTYGFNRKSHAALLGAMTSLVFTLFLAFVAVDAAHLSGQVDDVATFLNVKTNGMLNFSALLLGAMIIGILGVLDDIAITQAATVQELSSVASHLPRKEIFARALNVGREHVSALVNTIALAYTGAALPLVLLFMHSESTFDMIINRDIFATEILRIIVGSIGIILTVPITTALAVVLLSKKQNKKSRG